jgi:hypothetical protein
MWMGQHMLISECTYSLGENLIILFLIFVYFQPSLISIYLPPPNENTIESEMIEKLTKMIQSFMLYGIPNVQIDGVDWSWKSVSGDEMECLVITEKKIECLPMPVKERLEIWNSIYHDENIKLY